MEVVKSGHWVYRLEYHIVWVVKYRRKVLNVGVCGYLRRVMPKLLRSMPGVIMEEIGFDCLEKPICIVITKEVRLVKKSVLGGKYILVTGLFCQQRRH